MNSAIINLDKLLSSHESLGRVRSQLLSAERSSGVSDLHTNTITILRKQGARLIHSQAHVAEVVAFAVSPNGKYLATGSWVGDDYERGGTIQIWDIEMARCVNVLDPIEGGVGWPEYPNCLSWTSNSERLGIAFNTNSVGLFDPFGSSPDALIHADVTDGWSRPPAFCVLPDGEHVYISCWRGSEIPGALVSFKVKNGKRRTNRNSSPRAKAMAKKIPAAMHKNLENGHLEPPKYITPAPNGERIFCINSHGFAYAITLKTGTLDYITKVGLPAAYSPDGRFLAHTLAGLVIYDGQTGLPTSKLPMHMGMNALHWGQQGSTLRLAGVVSAENEFKADPGVHIYDDNVYRYSIDVKPREPSWDDSDFAAFAWAPAGNRAAILDEDQKLHIVSLGETVTVERIIHVKEELRGVFWASPGGLSENVIILTCRESIVFIDAQSGEIMAEHTFMKAPEEQRPLDTGEMDFADQMRPDPTFAIDDESWGAAFSEGVVIAPPTKKHKLDAHLAWSVDRRYAFPVRWNNLDIAASAAEVAQGSVKPAGVNWKKFKPAKSRKAPPPFPPANPDSLAPFFDALVQIFAELGPGWRYHVAENLRYACRLRARRGEIAEALAMTEHLIGCQESLCSKADLTAIAYQQGKGALLDEEFAFVAEEVESEIGEHTEVTYATAMFSAYAAQKNQAQSNAWLARAKAKLEPENNAWQSRLALIWALVEAGWDDEARALFVDKAPWVREPLCFYSVPFTVCMVREGHIALLFEFLDAWNKYRFRSLDWSVRDKLGFILAQRGLVDQLAVSKERFGVVVDDDRLALAKSREKIGLVLPSPSASDIATLAHDFAELQKTPRARRTAGTRALIQKAANCGHSGAVMALLPSLNGTDFNDRPQAAISALWTIATGTDVVPW